MLRRAVSPIAPDHLGQGPDASVEAREVQLRLEVRESRRGNGAGLGGQSGCAEGAEGRFRRRVEPREAVDPELDQAGNPARQPWRQGWEREAVAKGKQE